MGGITGQEQALTDYKVRAEANGPSLGPDTDTDKILPVDSPLLTFISDETVPIRKVARIRVGAIQSDV
jgi:hypothetical protein